MNHMDRNEVLRRNNIYIWKDSNGWHYDGPVGAGPRHVRRSGRGPYWRGPVSAQFIGALTRAVSRIQEADSRARPTRENP